MQEAAFRVVVQQELAACARRIPAPAQQVFEYGLIRAGHCAYVAVVPAEGAGIEHVNDLNAGVGVVVGRPCILHFPVRVGLARARAGVPGRVPQQAVCQRHIPRQRHPLRRAALARQHLAAQPRRIPHRVHRQRPRRKHGHRQHRQRRKRHSDTSHVLSLPVYISSYPSRRIESVSSVLSCSEYSTSPSGANTVRRRSALPPSVSK